LAVMSVGVLALAFAVAVVVNQKMVDFRATVDPQD